jgi:hypothetical protein
MCLLTRERIGLNAPQIGVNLYSAQSTMTGVAVCNTCKCNLPDAAKAEELTAVQSRKCQHRRVVVLAWAARVCAESAPPTCSFCRMWLIL